MSTFVKMFKPEFAELVRTGIKCQTIRPVPKRMPKVGDLVSLRRWEDKPYRSKQVVLGQGKIVMIWRVRMDAVPAFRMWLDGKLCSMGEADSIARADGFPGFVEIFEWFDREHGFPFDGILIRWMPIGGAQ